MDSDPDPIVPPGCEVLRDCSQRDSLNTFTVVPWRTAQSTRRYEVLLTLEDLASIDRKTGGNLEKRVLDSREMETMEMSRKETPEKTDSESDKVEETDQELGIPAEFGKLCLNVDAEKHLPEERDSMEDQAERDRMEEYRRVKPFRKVFNDKRVKDVPPPPPPPQLSVCWEEEETETQNPEETRSFGKKEAGEGRTVNALTIQNLNQCRYLNPTSNQEPYWDVNISSHLHSSDSDTPFTSSPQSSLQKHQPSPHDSKAKLVPSFEHSSPNPVSLFALAVSRRVQSLGNAPSPLILSERTTSSPTQHPQNDRTQLSSSQKLNFQSLISQGFISKIPPSVGPCNGAPPTSTAPPSAVMTTQARRRAWSSFSHAQ